MCYAGLLCSIHHDDDRVKAKVSPHGALWGDLPPTLSSNAETKQKGEKQPCALLGGTLKHCTLIDVFLTSSTGLE